MDNSDCSFRQLPFSTLFNTYVEDFDALSDFYSINPFNEQAVTEKANCIPKYENRDEVITALAQFHANLGIGDEQQAARQKLANTDALAFVTGQQLGLYGGPLFTIYKTITAILLAKKWEKKLNRPVVPVFWLADEDHDFEEIASVAIPGFDALKKINIEQTGTGKPVSDEVLQEALNDLIANVKSELPITDFSEQMWNQLNDCYKNGTGYLQAFAQLMSQWFSKHGVLFAGSHTKSFKALLKNSIKTSISNREEIHRTLESQSEAIAENFHSQVVVGSTNLFYLDDAGTRQKLDVDNGIWKAAGKSWTQEELLALADTQPERFSPNVFLRPIMQDVLLPTLGYVAGPGELAYYGQMKNYYTQFGLEMPAVIPRLSITLIEAGIERIMEKLPFPMCQYNMRIEDLEKAYIAHSDSHNIDGAFADWATAIKSASNPVMELICEVDPTLVKTSGKVVSGFENELQKLKGRVIRSLKQQEETQLKRIAKIQSQLFPDGLQERSVSPVFFMNKYGLNLWDELLSTFEEKELDLQKHHIYPLA